MCRCFLARGAIPHTEARERLSKLECTHQPTSRIHLSPEQLRRSRARPLGLERPDSFTTAVETRLLNDSRTFLGCNSTCFMLGHLSSAFR